MAETGETLRFERGSESHSSLIMGTAPVATIESSTVRVPTVVFCWITGIASSAPLRTTSNCQQKDMQVFAGRPRHTKHSAAQQCKYRSRAVQPSAQWASVIGHGKVEATNLDGRKIAVRASGDLGGRRR